MSDYCESKQSYIAEYYIPCIEKATSASQPDVLLGVTPQHCCDSRLADHLVLVCCADRRDGVCGAMNGSDVVQVCG
ncbi:hypothetical protein E2C01_091937 [Portunus trituberculatus]|uniref:Uncharacterized protein n=1 Tax=Portunus trituberculatus TaxID=210409 RepID=A0A5B7JQR2_PORTR|nr:hypothetical protein [Portunus trituberculatus]